MGINICSSGPPLKNGFICPSVATAFVAPSPHLLLTLPRRLQVAARLLRPVPGESPGII